MREKTNKKNLGSSKVEKPKQQTSPPFLEIVKLFFCFVFQKKWIRVTWIDGKIKFSSYGLWEIVLFTDPHVRLNFWSLQARSFLCVCGLREPWTSLSSLCWLCQQDWNRPDSHPKSNFTWSRASKIKPVYQM